MYFFFAINIVGFWFEDFFSFLEKHAYVLPTPNCGLLVWFWFCKEMDLGEGDSVATCNRYFPGDLWQIVLMPPVGDGSVKMCIRSCWHGAPLKGRAGRTCPRPSVGRQVRPAHSAARARPAVSQLDQSTRAGLAESH